MFNTGWFTRNQGKLLYCLNNPMVMDWFRYKMRIHRNVDRKEVIVSILPSNYTVFLGADGDNFHFRSDFRSHDKFAKRMYHGFKPVWWLAHSWDMKLANRLFPAWNLGYDSFGPQYCDPGDPASYALDGWVNRITAGTWSSMATGAGTGYSQVATEGYNSRHRCYSTTDQYDYLGRSFYCYDTRAIGAGSTVTAATLSICSSPGSKFRTAGYTPEPVLNIYEYTGDAQDLAANSYQNTGSTAYADSGVSYSSWASSGTYNDFAFNSYGMGKIDGSGPTKTSMRDSYYDVANSQPEDWTSGAVVETYGYYADNTGTTYDPKMVATYTVGGRRVIMMFGKAELSALAAAVLIKNPTFSKQDVARFIRGILR